MPKFEYRCRIPGVPRAKGRDRSPPYELYRQSIFSDGRFQALIASIGWRAKPPRHPRLPSWFHTKESARWGVGA
jgi:hypothetical protein